jgi:hypothetical protein
VSQRCGFKVLFSVGGHVGQTTFLDHSTNLSSSSAMPVMVASFLVYAWTTDQKTNVAGPIVALVFGGFSIMYVLIVCRCSGVNDTNGIVTLCRVIYSSTLAYLVDANPGRSSSAVACNSFFRGLFAFIASQVALPIRVSGT